MSKTVSVAFPLTASFLLPSEDSPALTADQVETRLRERISGVVVDREQGDRHVQENLKRSIDLGIPEILLTGEQSLIGRTLSVEFPVEGFPGITLSGVTFGFTYLDGCIVLDCEPFDLNALKAGALMFAERMELALSLRFGDVCDINLALIPGVISFEQMLTQQHPYFQKDEFRIIPIADWPAAVTTACGNWFARQDQRVRNDWIEKRGVPAISIPQLIDRLQSIGPVERSLAASRLTGYHDCFLLQYPDWTGILVLPGVPGTVLE